MLLTVRDVARRLNVTDKCVYALVAKKEIAHIRVGVGRGTIRIREADVSAYIAERFLPTAPAPRRSRRKPLRHVQVGGVPRTNRRSAG